MANYYTIKDGAGVQQQMGAQQIGSIFYPWHMLSVLVSGSNVPVAGDSNGNIGVNVISSALPTGAATSANQSSQITQETAIALGVGAPGDGTWSGSGSGSIVAIEKFNAGKLSSIQSALAGTLNVSLTGSQNITLSPSATIGLNASTNVIGKVGVQVAGSDVSNSNPIPISIPGGASLTGTVSLGAGEAMAGHFGGMQINPSSTCTRPANTSGYSAADLVANNVTAGSVVVPSVSCARIAQGSFSIERARLYCNQTSNMQGVSFRVRLWITAPTYTNGDNGAYVVATGNAGYLGAMTGFFEQWGDGAMATLQVDYGPEINVKLASGQSIYWDMETLTGYTPSSAAVFTFVPEVKQD